MKKMLAMVMVVCLALTTITIGASAQKYTQNQVVDHFLGFHGLAGATGTLSDHVSAGSWLGVKEDGHNSYTYAKAANAGHNLKAGLFSETIRTGIVEFSFDFLPTASMTSHFYVLMTTNGKTGNDDPNYLGSGFNSINSGDHIKVVRLTPSTGGACPYELGTDTSSWSAPTGGAYNDGKWHNCKLIFDYEEETIKIYLDGKSGATIQNLDPSLYGMKNIVLCPEGSHNEIFLDNVSIKHIPVGETAANGVVVDYKAAGVDAEGGKVLLNFSDIMQVIDGESTTTISNAIAAGKSARDLGIVVKGEDGRELAAQPTVAATDTGVELTFTALAKGAKYYIDVDTTDKMKGAANGQPAKGRTEFATQSASFDFTGCTVTNSENLPAGLSTWRKDGSTTTGIYSETSGDNTYLRFGGTLHKDPANIPAQPNEALVYRFGSAINSGKVEITYSIKQNYKLDDSKNLSTASDALGDVMGTYLIFDTENDGVNTDGTIDDTGIRTILNAVRNDGGTVLLNPLTANYNYTNIDTSSRTVYINRKNDTNGNYYPTDWIDYKIVVDYDKGTIVVYIEVAPGSVTEYSWGTNKPVITNTTPALEGIAFAGIENVRKDNETIRYSSDNKDGDVCIDNLNVTYTPAAASVTKPDKFTVNDFRVYESIDDLTTSDTTDKVWVPYAAETLTNAENPLKIAIKGYNPAATAKDIDVLLVVYSDGEQIMESINKYTLSAASGEFELNIEQGTGENQFDFAGIGSGKSLKCLVWDSLGNMIALDECLNYTK